MRKVRVWFVHSLRGFRSGSARRSVNRRISPPRLLVLAMILAAMDQFVTLIAESNDVLLGVVARVTAELLVVDLKLLH